MAPTYKLNPMMKFFVTGCEWKGDIERAEEDEAGLVWKLMNWCAAHMGSGGFIPNCLAWDRKTWQKEAGIERKIFRKYLGKSVFFREENGGVRVLIHDAAREAQTLRTSERQRNTALAKHAKAGHATADATADADIQKFRNSEFSMEGSLPPNLPPESDAAQPPRTDGRMEAGRGQAVGSEGKPKRPADVEEVERMARMMLPHSMQDDATRIAAAFFDENQARGWIDEDGHPVRNWLNRLRRYCETCAANEPHDVQASPQTDPQDFPRPSVDEVIEKLHHYRSCDSLDEAGLMAKAREFLAWGERKRWKNAAGRQISPRGWKGVFFTSFMGGEHICR